MPVVDLRQKPTEVGSGNAVYPGHDAGPIIQKIDFRFATLSEQMNVRRLMVIGEDDEAEAERPVDRDHEKI